VNLFGNFKSNELFPFKHNGFTGGVNLLLLKAGFTLQAKFIIRHTALRLKKN
jgi:hypothetical protein